MQQPYHLIFENSEQFKDYYLNDETEPIVYLPNFNTINIIVGANNSGKSRFMRHLMCASFFALKLDSYNQYNIKVNQYNLRNKHKTTPQYVMRHLKLDNDLVKAHEHNTMVYNKYMTDPFMRNEFNITEAPYYKVKSTLYYIPTLRTAHSFYTATHEKTSDSRYVKTNYERLDQDIYLDTLRKNYSLDNKLDVFTGMDLYEQVLNSRNAEKNVRDRFESFEKFLSVNFFDGKQIDIVAKFNKGESKKGKTDSELILIHVENEENTRELHHLGDGIQALIILMYKIFMAKDNSFFFIDEPELNLHPGMQRLFLEQIATNPELLKKKLTYVISTHSNHFLDLTLEKDNVSIYSFSPKQSVKGKDNQFIIKNVNRGDNELLKHLGVNNSSVFLANCSIWVEGVSDRNYIKAFLKSYIDYLAKNEDEEYKSLKEDIDYAFFEYAGSNIEHYLFEEEISEDEENKIESEINALALSNKIFLLADSDNAEEGSAKAKRLEKLEAIKKNDFTAKIIREVREIENLLTNDIWKEVLINFCNKKLLKKDKAEVISRIEKALSKFDSNSDKFRSCYIGKFLNKIRTNMGKIDESDNNVLNKIYEKKGTSFGTFIYKRELSEYVLEANFEWETLQKSNEIKQLTEDVYKFIIDSMN